MNKATLSMLRAQCDMLILVPYLPLTKLNPGQKVAQNYHVNKFRIELLLNHFLIGQEIIRYNNEIIEIILFF